MACDKVNIIESPHGISIDYNTKIDRPGVAVSESNTVVKADNPSVVYKFIGLLTSLGYHRPEARRIVMDAIANGKYDGNDSAFATYLCSLKKST